MRNSLGLVGFCALAVLSLAACGGSGGGSGGASNPDGGDRCTGVDCNDGNDCTSDACDPTNGRCSNTTHEDGAFCREGYCLDGECDPITSIFACTEQGVRDAIVEGGGPHGFDCLGPRTVTISAEIPIDNDVILDGRGRLTIDGDNAHRVFSVTEDTTAELWRIDVRDGRWQAFTLGGGGIYNQGTLTFLNGTISRCEALQICAGGTCGDGTGGGVLNTGTLTVVNSTISQNRATGGGLTGRGGGVGGGIANEGTLMIENCTLTQNSGQLVGGAMFNAERAKLTLLNSTVSGNMVSSMGATLGIGGGIANAGTVTVSHSTIAANQSAVGSGIESTMGTVTIDTTLLQDRCDGDIVSGGYNIESPANTCSFDETTDSFEVATEDLAIEPILNNGGPTATHALLPQSIAVDVIPEAECLDLVGEPLTTDQRGVARPQAVRCDVGAFELE